MEKVTLTKEQITASLNGLRLRKDNCNISLSNVDDQTHSKHLINEQ